MSTPFSSTNLVQTQRVPRTKDDLHAVLLDIGLPAADRLAAIVDLLPADSSAAVLAETLVSRKLLTKLQAQLLLRGQRITVDRGRYVLLSRLGQGGMGAVFKARHLTLKRDVALKVIDPQQQHDAELAARFRREIEVTTQLQHEHVINTLDVVEDYGCLILVMEYVAGRDLQAIVKQRGPLPADIVAAIAVQMAAGLAYAHQQGIVHRDIKPQNVLLSQSGSVKLLDMGLARVTGDTTEAAQNSLTRDGMVLGTVDFMPPEQAGDARNVDHRSDLYSLGATLYFLLSGRVPYPDGDLMSKLHRLATTSPVSLAELRPDLATDFVAAVEKLMAKAVDSRMKTAAEVIRVFEPFAAKTLAGSAVLTPGVNAALVNGPNAVAARDRPQETLASQASETLRETELPFTPDVSVTLRHRGKRRSSSAGGADGRWKGLGIAAAFAVLLVGGWWFLRSTPAPDEPPKVAGPQESFNQVDDPLAPVDYKITSPPHLWFRGEHAIPVTIGFGAYKGVTTHSKPFWSPDAHIAWSPSGKWLAVASEDGIVSIWNPDRQSRQTTLTGAKAAIAGLAWSTDGTLLAAVDQTGQLLIWSLSTSELNLKTKLKAFSPYTNVWLDFSPDGSEIAVATAALHQHANPRWQVQRVSTATGKLIWILNSLRVAGPVFYLDQDRLLVAAFAEPYSSVTYQNGHVLEHQSFAVINLREENVTERVAKPQQIFLGLVEHRRLFTFDGLNENAAQDGFISEWDIETGKLVKQVAFARELWPACISQDGTKIWLRPRSTPLPARQLLHWSTQQTHPLEAFPAGLSNLNYPSPNLSKTAVISKKGYAYQLSIFRSGAGEFSLALTSGLPIDWRPVVFQGRWLKLGGYTKPRTHFFDLAKGEVSDELSFPEKQAFGSVMICREGRVRFLVVRSKNGLADTAEVYEWPNVEAVGTPPKLVQELDCRLQRVNAPDADGAGKAQPPQVERVPSGSLRLHFLNDGQQLLIAAPSNFIPRVLDVKTGKAFSGVAWPDDMWDSLVATTSDSRKTWTAAFRVFQGNDWTGRVWQIEIDPETQTQRRIAMHNPGTHGPLDIRWADNGKWYAWTWNRDPRVLVHELPDGNRTFFVETDVPNNSSGYLNYLYDLDITANSQHLLAGHEIWHVPTRQKVWSPPDVTPDRYAIGRYQHGALLGDNQHVLIVRAGRAEVWNWRENRKRLTLHEFENGEWLMWNHETHHYQCSVGATKHFKLLPPRRAGESSPPEPLRKNAYEDDLGFEPKADQVGLGDLIR